METADHFLKAVLKETDLSEQDVLRAAESLYAAHLRAIRLWPDISPTLASRAAVVMLRASRDALDIDISSFAAMLDMPRSSAHRLLTEWQALGYCTLNPVGKRTYVLATPKMIKKSAQYIGSVVRTR